MISRIIKNSILADYRRKKVIVLLGARQVGKTTLLSELQEGNEKTLFLNCDNIDDVLALEGKTSTELKQLLMPYQLVFIDEGQRVKNIGLTLKMIGDLKLQTQVIVTGSSSLDMANEINEPATGRLIEYNLFPFSLAELALNSSERARRCEAHFNVTDQQLFIQRPVRLQRHQETRTNPKAGKGVGIAVRQRSVLQRIKQLAGRGQKHGGKLHQPVREMFCRVQVGFLQPEPSE